MGRAGGKTGSKKSTKAELASGLYWRSGTIWARVYANGNEHRRSLRTSDPARAQARLKVWRESILSEATGDPDCPTLQKAVLRWASEVLPKAVKPSVAKRYLVSAGQLSAGMGDVRVDQIDARTIGEYISRRSLVAGNATIRRDITALSRLLAACIMWGYRTDNPARFYDRTVIPEKREPMDPPTRAEIAAVIAAAPEGMRPILSLLAETGMRSDEAVRLQRRHVRAGAPIIDIQKTKGNRARSLPFVSPGGDASAAVAAATGADYLFPVLGSKGPYRNFASNFSQLMRRLDREAAEAGRAFRRWRAHDMRHAFAVRWLRAGGGIYALSRHLGHKSVKTTEIYLDHLSEAEREAAVRADQGR